MTTAKTEEKYPCYIAIQDNAANANVELPSEKNGTLLLSTVVSQFPGTVGLRFKSETGSWRGVRLTEDNIFDIPIGGWGTVSYQIVLPERAPPGNTGSKRKIAEVMKEEELEEEEEEEEEEIPPLEKIKKMTEKEILTDMLVRSIPFEASEDELKEYFEQYGPLAHCELIRDREGKPRGFGFIRYETVEGVEKCLSVAQHELRSREMEVVLKNDQKKDKSTPIVSKLFVGRLPKDIKLEEMQEYFKTFGDIKDCYIPEPFKGFGFVSFKKEKVAKAVLKATHQLKGQYLNVGYPKMKPGGYKPEAPAKFASNDGPNNNRRNNNGPDDNPPWAPGFGGMGGGMNRGGPFNGMGGGFGGGGFGGGDGGFGGGGGGFGRGGGGYGGRGPGQMFMDPYNNMQGRGMGPGMFPGGGPNNNAPWMQRNFDGNRR